VCGGAFYLTIVQTICTAPEASTREKLRILLLQPKKYRAPFLKEAETGKKKYKANAVTTTTNYTVLKTLRNHKPIRYRASSKVTKPQKKEKETHR